MQHLDDGFLHALADGEVPSDELEPVRAHLESCESCRARLDGARLEAETARELIEMVDVPALEPADRRIGGSAEERADGPAGRRVGGRWLRPLALAASLALAAGIGYYGRGSAPFADVMQPTSLGRIDTVFLEVPAAGDQRRENATLRDAEVDQVARPAAPQPAPPAQANTPARSDLAGARQERDEAKKRTTDDKAVALDQVASTGAAAAAAAPPKADSNMKQAEMKLEESYRSRAANESREQASSRLARKTAPPEPVAAPAAAPAEGRLLAKSAADASAVQVTFPRAVELLGGRIKLIEGMVPARLEAVGRLVRVVYVLDNGDLVLSQVSGADSLAWSLSGPVSTDSLARLRLRVR